MNRKDEEIERLREENQNYEAMKQGVIIRITDLEEENKRLREDNERLTQRLVVTAVNENRKLQGEVERLRDLLRECQVYVEGMSSVDSELCERVEKELSNE